MTADEIFRATETLDRNDLKGAMALWRKGREHLSPSDFADLSHVLSLLQDDGSKLAALIERETSRA